jgi:hypothetical protein
MQWAAPVVLILLNTFRNFVVALGRLVERADFESEINAIDLEVEMINLHLGIPEAALLRNLCTHV